jgi:hypothetical protein
MPHVRSVTVVAITLFAESLLSDGHCTFAYFTLLLEQSGILKKYNCDMVINVNSTDYNHNPGFRVLLFLIEQLFVKTEVKLSM